MGSYAAYISQREERWREQYEKLKDERELLDEIAKTTSEYLATPKTDILIQLKGLIAQYNEREGRG
jgi:cell division protein FtsB